MFSSRRLRAAGVLCSLKLTLTLRVLIQGLCGRTIMDCDCGSRIRGRGGGSSLIQFGGFYIVRADRSGDGGSCVALASDNGGGPGPRWQLVMDPNWQQWTMTVDYSGSGLDGGS
ncbi:unnamed protein product [Pleuronectes platessa]|uniref:Secreted protein n=1 Tax=Pleuronectes platessa TaxID=8262 RepID=A0A9N7YKP5_PLEPL|nr:unnamed protein product [Pleuronectes platessa]